MIFVSKTNFFIRSFCTNRMAILQKPIRKKRAISRLFQSRHGTIGDAIMCNTVLSRDHLTPELVLRLITPKCELWHAQSTESKFPNDPFWSIYWPGGQALARFILDNKKFIENRNVLDIGSGCGACALAAVKAGASIVVANDIDSISITAININSEVNNLYVSTCNENIIGKNLDAVTLLINGEEKLIMWDVILIGDMFYDTEFSQKLYEWLIKLVKMGKTVLVGDPGRHALAYLTTNSSTGRFAKIAEYAFTNIEHNGFPSAAVYKVRQNRNIGSNPKMRVMCTFSIYSSKLWTFHIISKQYNL